MIERRKYQDNRIRYNSGSDKPNGSKPPWGEVPFDLDKWLQELDPGGWMDEDDKPNGKKVSAPTNEPFFLEQYLDEKKKGYKGSYEDFIDELDRTPLDYASLPKKESLKKKKLKDTNGPIKEKKEYYFETPVLEPYENLIRENVQLARAAKRPQGILEVISSNMSPQEERDFYGSQLSPFYKNQYLQTLPLEELKRLFNEYLSNKGYL